uniref:Uncharacterized protein n=1 Tax=Ganoderma boninense TaxID=34458 RepID=A0A5K1K5F1_9APHY|nr:Uncharacterized protein [Ganoderma boninense]
MIFFEVMALYERPIIILSTSPDDIPEENEPLHTLTHVCQYWREVALGNPALWRRIHGRCSEQIEVYLARAGSRTVSLSLDVVHWGAQEEEPIPPPMASVIERHAARLHRLDLVVIPASQNIRLLREPLQAPHLEILTITSPCMYGSYGSYVRGWKLLFDSETSQLKALAIAPIASWIPCRTSFPRLTHLFLSFGEPETGRCHPSLIPQLLSNTPVLQFLHISFFIYDAPYSDGGQPPSDLVPLLHLRSLVFTSCSRKLIHAVISHLVLPGDVFIRLQGVLSGDNFDAHYSAPLPDVVLSPVTSLDICMGQDEILVVADGPTSGLWFEGCHGLGYTGPSGWEGWLLNLHRCLPLSHISYLHIYLNGRPAFFPTLLDQLPQLARLAVLLGKPALSSVDIDDLDVVWTATVTGDQGPDSADAFAPLAVLCRALSPSLTTGGAAQVRCPDLRVLTIECMDRVTLDTVAAYPGLPEMLSARASTGRPIRHVVVHVAAHPPSPDPHPHWQPEGEADGLQPVTVTALDMSRHCTSSVCIQDDARYEVVRRADDDADGAGAGAQGLCAFRMRDVWKVAGEDMYWELDSSHKPQYRLLWRP